MLKILKGVVKVSSRKELKEFYRQLKSKGINNKEFLYSYFFFSTKKESLKYMCQKLQEAGFKFNEIEKREDQWLLIVEKIEKHDYDSLFNLVEYFYEISNVYGVRYDGFDLGNKDRNSPLLRDREEHVEDYGANMLKVNDFPLLVTVDKGFDNFRKKELFRNMVIVNTPYKHGKWMLPKEEEMEKLDNFENFVLESLEEEGVESYRLLRKSHMGNREFLIAVKDKSEAQKIFENKIKEKNIRDYNFEFIEDKEWKMYFNYRSHIE